METNQANQPVRQTDNKPVKKKKSMKRELAPVAVAALFWCAVCAFFDMNAWYSYVILAAFTAGVFGLMKLALAEIKPSAKKKKEKEEKDRVFSVEFKDTEDVVYSDSRVLLSEIAKDRDIIAKTRPDLEKSMCNIEDMAVKIIDYCNKHPNEQHGSDRFLKYFLPTMKKFSGMYVTLLKQGIEGENITGTIREIEYAFRSMEDGFRKQLDSLFSEEALDISTDVDVLNALLEKEGLK